jgi:hypothetical protein
MALLHLKKASKDDALVCRGFCFVDELSERALYPTASEQFFMARLESRVRELEAGAPPIPKDAPKMWQPAPGDDLNDFGYGRG